MNRFNGKSVIVTGATSGIGLASARAFAAEGGRVVITGRHTRELDAAAQMVGHGCMAIQNDARSLLASADLAKDLSARKIQLDAAFINAGITRFAPLSSATETLWDDTFNTDAKGAYFQIQALLPLFSRGAFIVGTEVIVDGGMSQL